MDREIQRGSCVVHYGSSSVDWLLPILVEHDRSRHAERRILVTLILEVQRGRSAAFFVSENL